MKICSTHLKLKKSVTHVTLREFSKLSASCNISQETAKSKIWLILKEVRQTRVCGEEWHMLHDEQVFGNVFERRESKCYAILVKHRRKVKGEQVITLQIA